MDDSRPLRHLNRRSFLKASGAAAGALAVGALPKFYPLQAIKPIHPPEPIGAGVQVELGKRVLRGTRDGRVLESLDGGRTWRVITKLGERCAILALQVQAELVYAEIGLQGYRFTLTSADGRIWRTLDAYKRS